MARRPRPVRSRRPFARVVEMLFGSSTSHLEALGRSTSKALLPRKPTLNIGSTFDGLSNLGYSTTAKVSTRYSTTLSSKAYPHVRARNARSEASSLVSYFYYDW